MAIMHTRSADAAAGLRRFEIEDLRDARFAFAESGLD